MISYDNLNLRTTFLWTGMHGYLRKRKFKSENVYSSVLWPKKCSFGVKKFKMIKIKNILKKDG